MAMPDQGKNEQEQNDAVADVVEKARASGMRPDGVDDKALMDGMWGEADPPPPPYSPL
jgi:hypothetical protein